MFDIGSSLAEARRTRGLELDQVQQSLRIRRRYLEALETNRFEQLPDVVYARGFLREYAEFLGLDGSIYVEEYNSRFAPRAEVQIAASPSVARTRRRRPRGRVLAAAAILAAVVGLAAWSLDRGGGSAAPAAAPAPGPTQVTPRHVHPVAPAAPASPKAAPRLTLTAARGNCWIVVRSGSATGRVLYEDTLERGSTIHFALRKPLWVRVGAGLNLDARVGGRPLTLPHVTGNLLVGVDS